jgi:hypothetical protein
MSRGNFNIKDNSKQSQGITSVQSNQQTDCYFAPAHKPDASLITMTP